MQCVIVCFIAPSSDGVFDTLEKQMLKKIIYFGIGLASLVHDNFDELARLGEEKYNKFVRVNHPTEETIEIESEETFEFVAETETGGSDDLTAISGIGPTFARRLQDAGILTFRDLADSDEKRIKEVTGAAAWQANPQEWIVAARSMT
jgi:predicted flap endonuclease-1-like 5' DNA nuclease